ncbi:MAG: hypothetical protein J6Y62_09795 [Clostridia bacterium]|nr:hypothetical protein [Clostridia bacterium]
MDFKINRILSRPREEWASYKSRLNGSSIVAGKELKVDWEVYNIKDYLFTHDTIVASVAVEDDGFTIKPACVDLVNANGNAWSNLVLPHCYKTFIGGENYQSHVQVPALSKGKILDAVLRKVEHNGEQIFYCDILVATNRIHKLLVEEIESGRMNTLSMGATAKYIQCSVCGKIIDTESEDENEECEHIKKNLAGQWVDYKGRKKFCAMLVGAMNPLTKEYIPNSCVFIEASWVSEPAFEGAVTNYIVETPEVKAQRMDRNNLESCFNASINSLLVADKATGDVLKRLKAEIRARRQRQKIESLTFELP